VLREKYYPTGDFVECRVKERILLNLAKYMVRDPDF
jgi:hypothetical protein